LSEEIENFLNQLDIPQSCRNQGGMHLAMGRFVAQSGLESLLHGDPGGFKKLGLALR